MKLLLATLLLLNISCSNNKTTVTVKSEEKQSREQFRNTIDHQTVKVIGEMGTGSGFFLPIGDKMYVITNHHVCNTSMTGELKLMEYDTRGEFNSKILLKSFKYDLCIIEPSHVPFEVIKNPLQLAYFYKNGDSVFTFGYPNGRNGVLTSGEIVERKNINIGSFIKNENDLCQQETAKKEFDMFYGWYCLMDYQTINLTNVVNPGSSGSLAVNSNGDVIGVIFAKSNDMVNSSYMVPLEHLKEFIEEFSIQK